MAFPRPIEWILDMTEEKGRSDNPYGYRKSHPHLQSDIGSSQNQACPSHHVILGLQVYDPRLKLDAEAR
tara:strand:+ start:13877 stop:14083 length:207 start_codon:yes stop_codon:yes gene_type:complete